MTTITPTSKYFITSSQGDNQDFLDFGLSYGNGAISTVGEVIQYNGSSNVDGIFVRPGMTVDASNTTDGTDKIYVSGSLADYTLTIDSALRTLTLTRVVGANTESVTVSSGTLSASDSLVFANGSVSTNALYQAVNGHTTLPVQDAADNSTHPSPLPSQSATVKAFAVNQNGDTFASVKPGVNLFISGGAGVDKVYVADGTNVDASDTGIANDLIYLRGNWADYTKTIDIIGNIMTFTRVVGGHTETVKVTGGSSGSQDTVVFADGAAQSNDAFTALRLSLMAPSSAIGGKFFDPATTTPLYSDAEVMAALAKIAGIAQTNSATGTNPSVQDYVVAGVTGVSGASGSNAGNLGAINDALNSPAINGVKADTAPQIQDIVNAYKAILDAADGSANSTPLAGATYTNVGVTGVPTSGDTLTLLGSVVDQAHTADVNTVAELQAMADAAKHVMAAGAGSAAAAQAVSADDLAALGITGVTPDNLVAVQAAIQNTADAAMNTKGNLQDIVNLAIKGITPELAQIQYAAQNNRAASGDSNHLALTVAAFNAASISGVTDNNLAAINSALDSAPVTGIQADTRGEVQGIVDAFNAILAQADRQPGNTTPLGSTPYTLVGVTGVSGNPQDGSALKLLDSVVDASATDKVDSTPELQLMADAAAHVLADVATPTGQAAALSAADLAALAIDIYAPANLGAVQAAIKAVTDPTKLDTQYELQTLVNKALGKDALNALAAAAEANTAVSSGLNATSYSDAGVTGVIDGNAGNLASINSALDSGPINGARVDTVAKVQAVVNAFSAILAGADAAIGSTALTAEQYFAIGVTGVSGVPTLDGSVLHLLDDVADRAARSDVDTTAKVQAMADAAARVMGLTGNQGASLSAATSPSAQDLANLGITGVDATNLSAIQAALKGSTNAAVDTRQELQDLVNTTLNQTVPVALAALQYAAANDKAASGDTNHSPIGTDIYAKAGLSGVDDSNLAAINSALDSAPVGGAQVNSTAKVQALVNDFNAILASADGLPGNTTTPLKGDAFLNVGVTGVTGQPTDGTALSLLDSAVDQSPSTAVDSTKELQAMADAAQHVIANVGSAATNGTTVADLQALGISGVDASNLAVVQAAIKALTSPSAVDTQGELQRLVDGTLGALGAALLKISAAAQANNADSTIALTDYTTAGVTGVGGTTGVALSSVNSALNSPLIGADLADTTAEVQRIVDSYKVILDSANGTANDTSTPLTGLQYRNIGVTGVAGTATAGSVLHLLDDVVDGKPSGAVDTVPELQALVDAAKAVQTQAAGTSGLTMDQLGLLGVTGLSGVALTSLPAPSQQAVLGAVMAAADSGSGTDTLGELQALVSKALTDQQAALTKLQDAASANTATAAVAIQDYLNAGVSGVSDGTILTAVNSALDSGPIGAPELDTIAHAQAIVEAYKAILNEANGTAPDPTPADPTAAQYATIGASIGLASSDAENLSLLNDALGGKVAAQVDTIEEINLLGAAANAVQAQAAGTGAVSMGQLELLGVTDRSGAALTGLSAAEQALVLKAITDAPDNGTGTDTVAKIQTLVNTFNHAPLVNQQTANSTASGLFSTSGAEGTALGGPVIELTPVLADDGQGGVSWQDGLAGWSAIEYNSFSGPVLDGYSHYPYFVGDASHNNGVYTSTAGFNLRDSLDGGTTLNDGQFARLWDGGPNTGWHNGMQTNLSGLVVGQTYVYGVQWQQMRDVFVDGGGGGQSDYMAGGQLVMSVDGHDQVFTSSGLSDGWNYALYSFTATRTTETLQMHTNGTTGMTASPYSAPWGWATNGAEIAVDSLNAAQVQAAIAASKGAGATTNAVFGTTTDADPGAALKGWAITSAAADASGHHWQYSSDNGTSWTNMDSASSSQAILLATTDLVRWTSLVGSNTTLSARAVDNTSTDSLHTAINVSTNGGITAYSGNEAQLASGVLGKLQIAARDNTATASLVMQDYLDAGLVGVNDATILRAVNSALDSYNVNDSQLDSNAHAQLIVEDYKAILTEANGTAPDPTPADPTAAQYATIGASIGLASSDAENLSLLNDALGGKVAAQVDTIDEINLLAAAANAVEAQAAGTGAVSMGQLELLGVTDRSGAALTGLSAAEQTLVLKAITDAPDNGTGTDTVAKIQTLVNTFNHAPLVNQQAANSTASGLYGTQAFAGTGIAAPKLEFTSVFVVNPSGDSDYYVDTMIGWETPPGHYNGYGTSSVMNQRDFLAGTNTYWEGPIYAVDGGLSQDGGSALVLIGDYYAVPGQVPRDSAPALQTTLNGLTSGKAYTFGMQWQQAMQNLVGTGNGMFGGGQLVISVDGVEQVYTSSGVADNWNTALYSFIAHSDTATVGFQLNNSIGAYGSQGGQWSDYYCGGVLVVDTLSAAQIDAANPLTAATGASTSSLFGSVTDTDHNAAVKGWAITSAATDSAGHHWQYSSNGGSTWTNMDAASASQALYLSTTDLVRWTGVKGTNTELDARAVDNTGPALHVANAAATWVDASVSGGSTAFSANTAVLAANAAPIVLDLNHDGQIDYSHITMAMDGHAVDTAWAGPADAILLWNKFGDGQMHDSSQYVFGQTTGSDLSGLRLAFDSNNDFAFDAKDVKFAQFGLWQDANQNGMVDAGEFHTLSDLGIASLSLRSDGVVSTPARGVTVNGQTTATLSNGSSMMVADAIFSYLHSVTDSTLNPAVYQQPMVYSAHVL